MVARYTALAEPTGGLVDLCKDIRHAASGSTTTHTGVHLQDTSVYILVSLVPQRLRLQAAGFKRMERYLVVDAAEMELSFTTAHRWSSAVAHLALL